MLASPVAPAVTLAVPIDCDVTSFLRLARESPRLAADCEGSGFLDGLHIGRSPAFAEWADGIRANLVRRLSAVVASVTAEAVAPRQWREGIRYAERWVAVAPLDEEWYAAAPSFHGGLVGRSQEWDALTHTWRKAADGRAQIAIIEGDSGVGKSRLAEDFTRWVSASRGTVLRGRAYDSRGGVPFAPVIEALRSGIDAPGLAGTDPQWLVEVARVVPEIRDRFRSLRPASTATTADGWRLFEGIAQMLAALADESPVVVFIDDVHWCDADSCSLMQSLIRRLDAAPVLWCLTFSPGSVERDAAAARLVRALRTFRQAQALVLRPLNETEVWQLLRALGRVTAPDGARRLAARIHEVTAGFPFYVIELLKTLFAQEWLTVDPETGEWIVSAQDAGDAAAIVLAPTVHEAIAERIECLPNDPGEVLISLAASAGGCRADVLSHVHGISRLRAAAAGDALVERHLAIEEDGVYRCAHPVIARVVSDALGPSRRREVHRGLALALQVTIPPGGDAPDPGEIARHAEQGGERATAYRYAMLAAEGCVGSPLAMGFVLVGSP
jgi:predicted ATPase